ncbi:sigma-70 family RNA polymerase sigma factor [bacterium]|nr:MAG: sigma-70 family RNA polymerase sigma factor [bacterium]
MAITKTKNSEHRSLIKHPDSHSRSSVSHMTVLSATSERELVRFALSDKTLAEKSIVELWNRYKKRLYLYVKYKLNKNRYAGEEQEKYIIEDIIQNTFCDVIENLKEYNPKFEVSTWIYNITNKHFVRYVRETQKYNGKTLGFDDTAESYSLSSDCREPDIEFELKEFERIVIVFVQSLKTKEDREVFLLYLQNLHTKNIANLVGNTQDAVRARLNRTIKSFKKFLNKRYPEYLNSTTLSQIKNLNIRVSVK